MLQASFKKTSQKPIEAAGKKNELKPTYRACRLGVFSTPEERQHDIHLFLPFQSCLSMDEKFLPDEFGCFVESSPRLNQQRRPRAGLIPQII